MNAKRLTICIDEEKRKELKLLALEKNISVTKLLTMCIDELILQLNERKNDKE